MKHLLVLFTLSLFNILFAHDHEYFHIEAVHLSSTDNEVGGTLTFELTNTKFKHFNNVKYRVSTKGKIEAEELIPFIDANETLLISKKIHHELNRDLQGLQIEIIEVYGKRGSWGFWSDDKHKQVNTLGSEFYADAPWRMKKLDDAGNIVGIPIHFFLHDANLVPYDLKIDNIDIQLKNSNDPNFGPILHYDMLSQATFQSYFSNGSVYDADLDIQTFDLSSFETSTTSTIDFTIDSDFWDDFETVTSEYWYFDFTIPPYDLAGFDNEIDIKVTIEYANVLASDDVIGLRVFRANNDLPALEGYYRGDTHLHSMYTQNDAEIGLPLASTKQACSLTGIDWVITTDHTSDYDNYGSSIQNNWNRLKDEVETLNSQDTSLLFIPGQEVALNNEIDKLVHMLAYPNPQNIFAMPFIGDGNGDIFATSVSVNSALSSIESYNGFAYLAHPFATGDKLPDIPVDGGIWNLGHPDFPQNGSSFPIDGGNLICNDISTGSDVLSTDPNKIVKDGLVAGQIWNTRYNVISTGDELDPWNVTNSTSAFSQMDTTSEEFHFRRFQQGQEVINFINKIGLQQKNLNPTLSNWKFYYAAGTDAHGSFNYSNTDDFAGLGKITNNAVGKLYTVAYSQSGMGMNGVNILKSLQKGQTIISDGPLLGMGISTNGADNQNELLLGGDAWLDPWLYSISYINLDYAITDEFGKIHDIDIYVGTQTGEYHYTVDFIDSTADNSIQLKLDDLLTDIFGVGNIPEDQYMYIRAEMKSAISYEPSDSRNTSFDIFHALTNPIWFSKWSTTGISQNNSSDISIYPNPTNDKIKVMSNKPDYNTIRLFDQAGKELLLLQFAGNEKSVDLASFAKGIYYIQLIGTSTSSNVYKIVRQ